MSTTPEQRKQLVQWLEEHRDLFAHLPALVDDLLAAERECARLREAVSECRAEIDRLRAERAELADRLSVVVGELTRPMHDLVKRLRIEP